MVSTTNGRGSGGSVVSTVPGAKRSSGESVQMAFGGTGWVLVQPSEGRVDAVASSGGGGLSNMLSG